MPAEDNSLADTSAVCAGKFSRRKISEVISRHCVGDGTQMMAWIV